MNYGEQVIPFPIEPISQDNSTTPVETESNSLASVPNQAILPIRPRATTEKSEAESTSGQSVPQKIIPKRVRSEATDSELVSVNEDGDQDKPQENAATTETPITPRRIKPRRAA